MQFGLLILAMKMEGYKEHFQVILFFKKVKMLVKCQQSTVYGYGTMNDRKYQKWFAKFHFDP